MPLNVESAIDPEIPVVDSHHHLFDRAGDEMVKITDQRRFLIEEYTESLGSEHKVVASVAVEAQMMYRVSGPEELRVVGETEFLNGQAAMGATGLYGGVRVGAGIVGSADLRQGEEVRRVLEAHLEAAPHRFKGIRQEGLWDEGLTLLGGLSSEPHLYADTAFRRGFAQLAPLGLSFDAFVLAPQLNDVRDLAHAFPETRIILNHLGQPVGIGTHEGRLEEEFPAWRNNMAAISGCPNVTVKMGGLGSYLTGSPTFRQDPPAGSEVLAAEWRPYAEEAITLFGADRVMFESNVPTDGSGPFTSICNAYKRITAGCSSAERQKIFAGTAADVYRLDLADV